MEDVMATHTFDEIVISTLPVRVSRWLRQDLAHRAARRFAVPVTTITAADNTLPSTSAPAAESNRTTSVTTTPRERVVMAESVYKIIELVGTSTESWEKAAAAAVLRASQTFRDMRVAEVVELDMVIDNGAGERVPGEDEGLVQVRGRGRVTRRQIRLAAPRLSVGAQEHRSRRREATAADGGDLCVPDLAGTTVAAQLDDGFVDETHAVGAAGRELTAVRVERDHAALAGDVPAAVEEVLRLADAAEAEPFEPRHAVEREAVVELGDLHVGGPQRRCGSRGARPAPSTCGSWVIVDWSHSMRSVICVPTASTSTGGCRRSPAVSRADTMTATAASHGTSQSYSPNGVVIMRADR